MILLSIQKEFKFSNLEQRLIQIVTLAVMIQRETQCVMTFITTNTSPS